MRFVTETAQVELRSGRVWAPASAALQRSLASASSSFSMFDSFVLYCSFVCSPATRAWPWLHVIILHFRFACASVTKCIRVLRAKQSKATHGPITGSDQTVSSQRLVHTLLCFARNTLTRFVI